MSKASAAAAAISCVPGQCVAVGRLGSSTLQAFTLSAGKWSAVTLPGTEVGSYPILTSVSCPQLGECVAVGYASTGGAPPAYLGFADVLVNDAWTAMTLPADTPPLFGVSCVSSAWCMAVGFQFGGPMVGTTTALE
jgi:hypothetical protein